MPAGQPVSFFGGAPSQRVMVSPMMVITLSTRAICAVLLFTFAGCASDSGARRNPAARSLTLADFSAATTTRAVEPAFYGELPVLSPDDPGDVDDELATEDYVTDAGDVRGENAPPVRSRPAPTRAAVEGSLADAPAQRWVIDGLLGQINGRPVYANEFLLPLEASLLELAANPDRAAARAAMSRLVRERFRDFVNSELIISEAEAQLTPEQQQGLLAWLHMLREGEIAARGGTQAGAQSSLEEELGMDIDEFLRQRRDAALASTLLQRRVEPRTIVSNRDVEREYRRREAEFNPPPTILIGRIRLTARESDRAAEARRRFDEGKGFSEVATLLEIADGGAWRRFNVPAGVELSEAIDRNEDLAESIRSALSGLAIDTPSIPVEQGGATTWYAILGFETPPGRGLYDPDVQLELRAELRGRRGMIERARYISSLRSRWISEDISIIEERLVQVAFARYGRLQG